MLPKEINVSRELERLRTHLKRAQAFCEPANLTLEEWLGIIQRHQGLCAYCQIRKFEHLEHVHPLGIGYGTTSLNCVPACRKCNNAKSNYRPREDSPFLDAQRHVEGVIKGEIKRTCANRKPFVKRPKVSRYVSALDLKQWRLLRGLSINELAEKAHAKVQTIKKIEEYRICENVSVMRRLAEALDIEISDFHTEIWWEEKVG